jgi:hypothetical protein
MRPTQEWFCIVWAENLRFLRQPEKSAMRCTPNAASLKKENAGNGELSSCNDESSHASIWAALARFASPSPNTDSSHTHTLYTNRRYSYDRSRLRIENIHILPP